MTSKMVCIRKPRRRNHHMLLVKFEKWLKAQHRQGKYLGCRITLDIRNEVNA